MAIMAVNDASRQRHRDLSIEHFPPSLLPLNIYVGFDLIYAYAYWSHLIIHKM